MRVLGNVWANLYVRFRQCQESLSSKFRGNKRGVEAAAAASSVMGNDRRTDLIYGG